MKRIALTFATILAAQFLLVAPASADDKKPTLQQERMRDCNRDAEGMKGQERKDFMKSCLSGKQAANKAAREERREERKEERAERKEAREERREEAKERREERKEERKDARQSQQEKMKGCNASAKGMKGDERKAYMSNCLKN